MSKLPRELPRLKFSHVLKKFPGEFESLYYDDFFKSSLPIVRIGLVLAVILYSAFGLLDIWVVPEHKMQVWIIRFAIVIPLVISAFVLTYFSFFKKYMQPILGFVGFALGSGIVVMIAFASESELGFKFYYAGLMLVIMWVYALVRLRFVYAVVVAFLITFSYEVVAIFINGLTGDWENIVVFINNNFFFLSSNIIGMIASFTLEFYLRKNYLLRLEIERSFNLTQKYLENIKEGLILVDQNYTVLNQYSRYATEVFESQFIEGMNFIDLIYSDTARFSEDRSDLSRFLKFLFTNRSAEVEMIMSINPLKKKRILLPKNDFVDKEIIIDADFIRVYTNEGVEYVIVIFEDITEKVKFEEEMNDQKTRYQEEIESISAILRSGPNVFNEFIDESQALLASIHSRLPVITEGDNIHYVFRQIHSIKGLAKHLELNHISSIAHILEDKFSAIRDNQESADKKAMEEIESMVVELFRDFKNTSKLIERFKSFLSAENKDEKIEPSSPLQMFLDSLPQMVDQLSNELGKHVKIKIENQLESLPFLKEIKSPIIHLVRNSIDHGLEDQFERLSAGKSAEGHVFLSIYSDSVAYNIEVSDDGRGIDFHRVLQKAIEKGLISKDESPVTKSRILKVLFVPGFSSKGEVTNISGRGVGLDLVKDSVDSLGGRISVSSRENSGTKFAIRIPL